MRLKLSLKISVFRALFWTGFLILSGTVFCPSLARSEEPALTKAMADHLLDLPYGTKDQTALILRSRHITKIDFFGAGRKSQAGFVFKEGVARRGVWFTLRNRGDETWASASVQFTEPIDFSNYDSVVLWVRANLTRHRLIVGLQDPIWSQESVAQVSTDLLPAAGLEVNKIIQISIPFSAFTGDKPLDKTHVSHLSLQFGSDVTGNPKVGSVDIFGVALVKQTKRLASTKFIPAILTSPVSGSEEPVALASKPKENKKPAATKSPGFEWLKKSKKKEPVAEASVPAVAVEPPAQKTLSPEPSSKEENHRQFPIVGFILSCLLVGASVALGILFFRWRKPLMVSAFGKVFRQVHWSPQFSASLPSHTEEKKFWKALHEKGVRHAWLSPFEATGELLTPNEPYYADHFLERQVTLASKAGIQLLPSLSFVRTVFQYETFLMNPRLYQFKHVAPSDRHFSDQELRSKNIGYFPVWIPPFWQRQHALPERLLVAFGRMPGVAPSNDSVQFNLGSEELRKYAIKIIEKYAKICPGVRIEGAASLLNVSLMRYWGMTLSDQQRLRTNEFWYEVIGAIKTKYPKFIFVADGAGADITLLRDLGFDYFENSQLRDVLINQIRLEEVGGVSGALSWSNAMILQRSIYDLAPLFSAMTSVPAARHQNQLCAYAMCLLPGHVQHEGSLSESFSQYLRMVENLPAFQKGQFILLPTTSSAVLSFARWDSKSLYIVTANFAQHESRAHVKLDSFTNGFRPTTLYLFTDILHGTSYPTDLASEPGREPAVAVLGQDIRENGLPLDLPALSLRVFSVNLTGPVLHEKNSQVRQLHKA